MDNNIFASTFVVSRVAKGNWDVTDNNAAGDDGFKNWVAAMSFARKSAMYDGANVIRLSSKIGGGVVEVVKPRVAHARKSLTVNAEVVAPAFEDAPVEEDVLTENSLNELPTPALIAVWNANGGNITGKFKGARKSLVAKILVAQAA